MPLKRFRILLPMVMALVAVTAACAQEQVFQLDPARSSVDFTLADVLHTVHGTFRMKDSAIHFDRASGAATGALVVDATSGESGSNGRDKKMHKEILESRKYPEIRFTVQKIQGNVPASGSSQVEMTGIMTLHGADHPMTVTAPVQVSNGTASADVHFIVPYVQWGLKNPSTFILRVSDKVDIVVHAVGTLATTSAAKQAH